MEDKYKTVEDSTIVMSELMLPSKTNFNGKIHGGYILSLLDQIAFACASKHSEHYCVTASVGAVDFLRPIEVGELVTMKSSVNYVGQSSMVIGIRVEAENIQTGKRKYCNSCYFTMVAKTETGKSAQVPGLILKSNTDIRRFVRALIRLELKQKTQKQFETIDFSSPEVLDRLKNYRVKVDL